MRVVGGVLVGGWVSVDGGGGVGWVSARSVEKGVYMVPGVGRQGILGCLYGLFVHEVGGGRQCDQHGNALYISIIWKFCLRKKAFGVIRLKDYSLIL